MAIDITLLKPINITNVNVDTEITINFNGNGDTIDTLLVIIRIDSGAGDITAFQSGLFQNNWTGEIITNAIDDVTIVCIQPTSTPNLKYDSIITVLAGIT